MFYLLTLNIEKPIDINVLKKKLDLAIDWVQIMPNVFIIKSYRKKDVWYLRMKLIVNNNLFFITEISLDGNYKGWLYKMVWTWIADNKKSSFK
jgi:hypothetical protein